MHVTRFLPLIVLLVLPASAQTDFGDAPEPYPTTIADDGARHAAVGPLLGAGRDTEANGAPTPGATGDDTTGGDDEDGVSFGAIRVGALGRQATLTIANAPGGAKLDAWIDFNRDGSWGGPGERIAHRLALAGGTAVVDFDVPSWAAPGTAISRFRLSTAGGLGPTGAAADGEVEDHAVTVQAPLGDSPAFSSPHAASTNADTPRDAFAVDLDGDGDMDVLSIRAGHRIVWGENDGAQQFADHIVGTNVFYPYAIAAADVDGDGHMDMLSGSGDGNVGWYRNDGNQVFTFHTIDTNALTPYDVMAADLDADGDLDVLTAAYSSDRITWYENDGAESFTERDITTDADGARSVFAADVDSDGDLDVLSASYADDKIAWYENDGSESFTTHVIASDADAAYCVFAADMDGDGDMDVLSASGRDDRIAWYENNGGEVFTTHTITNRADAVQSVSAADMDGDGDMDVLAASENDRTVAWYENAGGGVFRGHVVSTELRGPRSAVAADMDGDGDLDVLACAGGYDWIAWYEQAKGEIDVRGNGVSIPDGAMTPAAGNHTDFGSTVFRRSFAIHNTGGSPLDVSSISLSGAGAIDFTIRGPTVPLVLEALTSVTFEVDFYPGVPGTRNATIIIANNDADEASYDFAIGGMGTDGDLGDAPLPYPTTRAKRGALHAPGGPTLGALRDVEWDGAPTSTAMGDDTTGSDDEDGVAFGVVRAGALDAEVAVTVANAPVGARLDAWIDFNGDGSWGGTGEQIADRAPVSNGDNTVAFDVPAGARPGTSFARLRLSTTGGLGVRGGGGDGEVEDLMLTLQSATAGDGGFAAARTIGSSSVRDAAAADMDGDGDMDVVAVSLMDGLLWYENDGSQDFTAHSAAPMGWAERVFPVDLDGDGDTDILTPDWNGQRILWHENDGNQNFANTVVCSGLNRPHGLFAADMDGDGDIDLLSANAYGHAILLHENDGQQRFTNRRVGGVTAPYAVFAADVDSDGDMDVLSASTSWGQVVWFQNQGSNSFTRKVVYDKLGDAAYGVYAADMDGDGDMDVLSTLYKAGVVAWHENDGNESFTFHTMSATAVGAMRVSAADMDGDGDMDALASLFLDNRSAWYENDGSAQFAERTISHATDEPWSAIPADMDNDGDLDVLAACDEGNAVLWYEQAGPEIDVLGNGISIADGATLPSPSDHTDFGAGVYQRVFTITNAGGGSLNVDAITFSGGDASDFHVTGLPLPAVVPAGGAAEFTVHLYPTAAGARGTTLQIANSDTDEAPYDFAISGVGFGAADFGDAPAPYPTTRAAHGPLHAASGPTLGTWRDTESDGSPDALAAGDDNAVVDDEDAVRFGPVRPGALGARVSVTVTNAPAGAGLDAWVDFDSDGCWGGAWERIADGMAVSNGTNVVVFDVPGWARAGTTISRFRLSTAGGVGPAGAAADGEVEDHLLSVQRPTPGSRLFGAQRTVCPYVSRPNDVFAADVDGDGDMDVISASGSGSTGKTMWHENKGRGSNFANHVISRESVAAMSVFAEDMDGDGDVDVLSASQYGNNVAWYENAGQGTGFVAHTISTNVPIAESIHAADVDGDGDMDALTVSLTGEYVVWHENDGDENFADRVITRGPERPSDVVPVDVDGDGDLDILCPTVVAGVMCLWNEGRRGFVPTIVSRAPANPLRLFATDLDSDGDVDVLCTATYDHRIWWLENEGKGAFVDHPIIPNIENPVGLFAADLDGDGDVDILATDFDSNVVLWYENDGSQTFTGHTVASGLDEPTGVTAADMDGDGDLDVVYAVRSDKTIIWHEQLETVLRATSGPHGTIVPSGDLFVPYGGSTNFVITPDPYCYIADIQTNAVSLGAVAAVTWSNVTAGGTIHARFGEDRAALGTPHWWLAQHGWTSDFDVAETNNPDGDLHLTWREYIGDTDPTNASSLLRITAISNVPPVRIYFDSSSNRAYSLESRVPAASGEWTRVSGQADLRGTGDSGSLSHSNPPPHCLYRIGVQLLQPSP